MKSVLKVFAIISISLLVACGNKPTEVIEDNQNVTTATPEENSLPLYRVATVGTYPPFATKDKAGLATGFDIDILKAIAKNQGFQVEFVTHPWENWRHDLTKDSDIDIWTAGISINDDRKQFTDFSAPYMDYNIAMVTLENTPMVQDLAYKIGVEANSSDSDIDVALSYIKNAEQIKKYPSHFIAIESLLQNKINAVIGNEKVLAYITQSFPEYKFKTDILQTSNSVEKKLGFMVRKNKPEILDQLNQGLNAIKVNGEFYKIQEKWFDNFVK